MAVAERRSPDSSIAIYARSAAIASGLAALLVVYLALSSSPTPVEQEAEPTVVKMKDWRLSGGAAKREMARFFDNQNAVSEAEHLSKFVADHPFFKDSKGRFLMNKRDEKMRVVGFSKPHRHEKIKRVRTAAARDAMTPERRTQ